jgi:ABC-type nitrate/sulfonate/bicarbonate transport system substrate-binding protein
MTSSNLRLAGAVLCGSVLFSLSLVGEAAAQTVTVRYGQAFSAMRSIFALPLLVAEREKFFAREGLNFVVVPVAGGGEKLVEALHDGTADVSHVATGRAQGLGCGRNRGRVQQPDLQPGRQARDQDLRRPQGQAPRLCG